MRNLLLIIISLVLIACNEQAVVTGNISDYSNAKMLQRIDTTLTVINLNEQTLTEISDHTDIVGDYKFIPLSHPKKGYISLADRIIFTLDNKILVVDNQISEKIDIYDISGKWLNTIDRQGRGPGEYIKLFDASYDIVDSLIVIYDLGYNKFYDTAGNFVKSEKTTPSSNSFQIGDITLKTVLPGQSQPNSQAFDLIINKQDSILYKAMPTPAMCLNPNIAAPFSDDSFYCASNSDMVLFNRTYCDTIYQIIPPNSYSAKYVIEQDKSMWDFKDDMLQMDIMDYFRSHNDITFVAGPIYETPQWLYFGQRGVDDELMSVRHFFYNKQQRELYDLSAEIGLFTQFSPALSGLYGSAVGLNGDYFVRFLSDELIGVLSDYLSENKQYKVVNPEFEKIIENKDKYAGVIVLCKFSVKTKAY